MGYFDDIFGDPDSFSDGLVEGPDYSMENGYRIMTEEYLVRRGYCCSNGCRNCPYQPKAQKGNTVLRKGIKASPSPSQEGEKKKN
ncbi:MAG: hypothetical protein HN778_13795 [Prolixibacteraceae bacterium]|nr:hypothetical protein [Prolixibacteraceae bacterium]MBT6763994.1 hypothetical protein [Prolixibacteraceae bacterium]MBT6999509.1 hypothetical protein [Prolixibacteraceae bacterium]MBT7395899.1 hypothetical protein [Prolixibacteraceae bacterium]